MLCHIPWEPGVLSGEAHDRHDDTGHPFLWESFAPWRVPIPRFIMSLLSDPEYVLSLMLLVTVPGSGC